MSLLDDNYMPVDIDDQQFLSELPIDILKNCIRSQFQFPYENRKRDYIETYREHYQYTMENGEELDILEAEEVHDDFIRFMQDIFFEFLEIGIDNLDEKSADDQLYLLDTTVRFFVRYVRKNFTNLIVNYITKYPEVYQDIPDRKDVTYFNYKNEGVSSDDIKIIANLHSIIQIILEKDFDVDEFFELVQPDGYSLEYEYVKRKFDENELTGNFVSHYIDMIMDESFLITLGSRVKNRILKKYPDRKVVIPPEEQTAREVDDDPEATPKKRRTRKEKVQEQESPLEDIPEDE